MLVLSSGLLARTAPAGKCCWERSQSKSFCAMLLKWRGTSSWSCWLCCRKGTASCQQHPLWGAGIREHCRVWDMHYGTPHTAILALNRGFSRFFLLNFPAWLMIHSFYYSFRTKGRKMEPSSSLLHLDKTRIAVFMYAWPY